MNYNPYTQLRSSKDVDKDSIQTSTSTYNPYAGLRSYQAPERMELEGGDRPWRPVEEMTPAERREFDYAGKHPELYGIFKGLLATCEELPIVSYLKFLSPEERHDFMSLNQQQQTNALLHMALDNAMWAGFGAPKAGSFLLKMGVPKRSAISGLWWTAKQPVKLAARGAGVLTVKALPKLAAQLSEAPINLLRVEDALKKIAILSPEVDFKGFKFKEFTAKILKKEGFRKKEIAMLLEPLVRGEGTFSRMDLFNLSELSRKNYKFSKVFQKNVPLLEGKTILRAMHSKFAKFHSEPLMEALYKKRTFEKALGEQYGEKELKGFHEDFSLRVFQQSAAKLYPELGKTFNFGEASLDQMANITLRMIEHPMIGMKAVMPGAGSFTFPNILPKRVVYGLGQAIHHTMTRVYEPIKLALGRRNRNYFNHILLWAKLLEQEGLYTSVKIKASGEFKAIAADFFTPEVSQKLYKILVKADDLTRASFKATTSEAKRALLAKARSLPLETFGKNDPAILLYNCWKTYSDHLYSDFVKGHFSRTLGKLKAGKVLPNDILKSLTEQSRMLEYEMDNLFSTVNKATYAWRMGSVKRFLGRAQRTILRGAKGLSKEELIARKQLASLFEYDSKKGFPAYLENYVARLRTKQLNLASKWRNELSTTRQAAFRHPRKKTFGEEGDFATMLESRTMAQASELYLYDSLEGVVRYAKRLPPAYRDYIEADIAGTLGLPSTLDHKVAWFLTKSVGKFERFFGKSGIWDEWRVIELGHTINTLTYLGALGFKPFSAVRNLFQTLINVPADLGGIKDLGTLASGAKKALDPKVRKKLIDWGAITEFAPEIHLRPSALPFGKKMLWGKTLPSLKKIQDTGLWLFKASDRWNRYVSGGAALQKWEMALQKVGGKIDIKNVEQFVEHLNLAGRRDYAQHNVIKNLIGGKQNIAEAEKQFVLDVIADTQYLYGVADAPLIIRKYGALGKTGFIFQSWWMNYGANLEKWIRTGESLGRKTDRMFTAMTSAAIAGTLMSTMWGEQTAIRTVGMGPFPKEANEFMVPPAWKPIYHAIAAISNCQDPNISSHHAKRIFSSAGILLPGYLQAKATYRGTKEEGFEGFAKSILRLKRD